MKKALAIWLSVLLLMTCVPMGAIPVSATTDDRCETSGHVYWADCDAQCRVCGALRETTASHLFNGHPCYFYCVLCETYVKEHARHDFQGTGSCRSCGVTRIGEHFYKVEECGSRCTDCDEVTTLTGTTGDCTWTLVDTHLTISGNGKMGDYVYQAGEHYPLQTPWGTDIGSAVTAVTIGKGVTHIGNYAFYQCPLLTDVYYEGSEWDKTQLSKGNHNDDLLNAAWHCNYIPEPMVVIGDANGDGNVNNRDLGLLQQYLNGWDVSFGWF